MINEQLFYLLNHPLIAGLSRQIAAFGPEIYAAFILELQAIIAEHNQSNAPACELLATILKKVRAKLSQQVLKQSWQQKNTTASKKQQEQADWNLQQFNLEQLRRQLEVCLTAYNEHLLELSDQDRLDREALLALANELKFDLDAQVLTQKFVLDKSRQVEYERRVNALSKNFKTNLRVDHFGKTLTYVIAAPRVRRFVPDLEAEQYENNFKPVLV